MVLPAGIHPVFFERRYACSNGKGNHALAAPYRRGEIPRPLGTGIELSPRFTGCRLSPRFLSQAAADGVRCQSLQPLSREAADHSPPYLGVHVVVLVHGFQGSSFDMRLIKNSVALLH